jgi:hypothetical protein
MTIEKVDLEKVAILIDKVRKLKDEYLLLSSDEQEAYDAIMDDMVKGEENVS